jgi:Flp pilus assembly protein TadD
MRRLSIAIAAGASLLALPGLTVAMGGGGMGGMGGGAPGAVGGRMGPGDQGAIQPEYDPAQEYQKGAAALQAGKYKDAVRAFSHVVDSEPKSADGWLMLGESKSGAGDEKGAEKAYERSVKLDDSSIQARRELAISLVKLGQTDKAQAQLDSLKASAAKCGDTCPQAADLKAAISAVQGQMTPGSPPAAANDSQSHLSLATPEEGAGAYVRAVSLINEQRWDDALASLAKASMAIGPHPDILTYEGYVWRHKGDWAKAEDYYRQALALDPENKGATEYYGELKVLKGDVAGARAMLAKLDNVCTFGCAEAEELRRWIAHGGDPAA